MSTLKVGGLATGMDIEQMVKELVKAQSYKLDKIKQNKQIAQWQQEDYRTINNSLRSLRDKTFDLRLQRSFLVYKTVSSNDSAIIVSSSSSATPGSYKITVNRLAQGVIKGSQEALTEETNADGTVQSLAQQLGLSGTVNFTLEGKNENGVPLSKSFSIDTNNTNIFALVQEINNAKIGITANYDASANRFFMTTTGTGEDYGINISQDDSGLFSDIDGDGSNKLKLLLASDTRVSGQNAQYSFGDMGNLTSSSNTVTVGGITLNLKQGGGATSTVTVTRDTDEVFNKVKSFVDLYNSTIELVNKELSEKSNRDYLPLTDEQREQLGEKQQEQWEEKAKSGLLRNDNLLTNTVYALRRALNSVITGITETTVNGSKVTYNSLAAIGIVTGSYEEQGKLYLKNDGEDLKKALEADPESIMKLFTSGEPDNPGIAQKMYSELNNSINSIIDKAGIESSISLYDNSALGKKLTGFDRDITIWTNRLKTLEERYFRQFTAMEKAISQMNSQSSWLAQQFSSNG